MKWCEENGKCEKGCLVRRFMGMDEREQERERRNLKMMPRMKRGSLYWKRRMMGYKEFVVWTRRICETRAWGARFVRKTGVKNLLNRCEKGRKWAISKGQNYTILTRYDNRFDTCDDSYDSLHQRWWARPTNYPGSNLKFHGVGHPIGGRWN